MLHNHIHYNLLVCLDIQHGIRQTKVHFEKYLLHTIRSSDCMILHLVFVHIHCPYYTQIHTLQLLNEFCPFHELNHLILHGFLLNLHQNHHALLFHLIIPIQLLMDGCSFELLILSFELLCFLYHLAYELICMVFQPILPYLFHHINRRSIGHVGSEQVLLQLLQLHILNPYLRRDVL